MRPALHNFLIAATLLSILIARPVLAGPEDFDGDLIPQSFDNCSNLQNGPNQGSNQIDSDFDGYGNRCDTDYDDNFATTAADFGALLGVFGRICDPFLGTFLECQEKDHDGNRSITVADFGIFLGRFSRPPGAPGPSGMHCAGTAPCHP